MTILIMKIQEISHAIRKLAGGEGCKCSLTTMQQNLMGEKKNFLGKKEVCIKRNLKEPSPFFDGGVLGVNRKSGKGSKTLNII